MTRRRKGWFRFKFNVSITEDLSLTFYTTVSSFKPYRPMNPVTEDQILRVMKEHREKTGKQAITKTSLSVSMRATYGKRIVEFTSLVRLMVEQGKLEVRKTGKRTWYSIPSEISRS